MIDREAARLGHGMNRRQKRRSAVLAVGAAAAAAVLGYFGFVYVGWATLPGTNNVFFIDHGEPVRDSWIRSGEAYLHTDPDGRRVIGLYEDSGDTYLFSEAGEMETGWKSFPEGTRYFSEYGIMARDWQKIGEEEYYFGDDGILRTGWITVNEDRYLLAESGARMEGWQMDQGLWYYFDPETGILQTGWLEDNGKMYLLAEDGHMLTGEQEKDGALYYLCDDGSLYAGWLERSGGVSYFSAEGPAVSGWNTIDDKLMYFDEDHLLQRGLVSIEGDEYYLEKDGSVSPGWHEIEEDEGEDRFYVCRDGYVLGSDVETGNSGRLIIRDCGVDVALYTADSRDDYQSVTDAEDSALVVKERRDVESVIADRKSQGFAIASAVEDESYAYVIDPSGGITEYVCAKVKEGRNTGEDVVDEEEVSVWKQNEGGFCTYTSAGTGDGSEVRIVFWQPV